VTPLTGLVEFFTMAFKVMYLPWVPLTAEVVTVGFSAGVEASSPVALPITSAESSVDVPASDKGIESVVVSLTLSASPVSSVILSLAETAPTSKNNKTTKISVLFIIDII
jgi:hypothetical protein